MADTVPVTPGALGAGAISAETYKRAFRRHPAGVAVITADPGDGPVAMTVTSVTSINAEPPLLLFSVSPQSSSTPGILQSETVIVHLLTARDIDVARLGATSGADRFPDSVAWGRLPTGEPLYLGIDNWLRCRIARRVGAGTSTIVIAEVIGASDLADGPHAPLVYHNRSWHRLSDATQIAR